MQPGAGLVLGSCPESEIRRTILSSRPERGAASAVEGPASSSQRSSARALVLGNRNGSVQSRCHRYVRRRVRRLQGSFGIDEQPGHSPG
jgi:hypothetical protein